MALNLVNGNNTNIEKIDNNVKIEIKDEIIENVEKIPTIETNVNELNEKVDSIIESGSNENGNYIKYSDGTMICYGHVDKKLSGMAAWGSLYNLDMTDVLSYPQNFITLPIVNMNIISDGAGSVAGWIANITTTNDGITKATFVRPTTSLYEIRMAYIAIGKWK